jgi:hypothetical protein
MSSPVPCLQGVRTETSRIAKVVKAAGIRLD